MIMEQKKVYSWVLRILNSSTGEVEYRNFAYLTAAEIEQEAAALISGNSDLYVAVFKLHKMF